MHCDNFASPPKPILLRCFKLRVGKHLHTLADTSWRTAIQPALTSLDWVAAPTLQQPGQWQDRSWQDHLRFRNTFIWCTAMPSWINDNRRIKNNAHILSKNMFKLLCMQATPWQLGTSNNTKAMLGPQGFQLTMVGPCCRQNGGLLEKSHANYPNG